MSMLWVVSSAVRDGRYAPSDRVPERRADDGVHRRAGDERDHAVACVWRTVAARIVSQRGDGRAGARRHRLGRGVVRRDARRVHRVGEVLLDRGHPAVGVGHQLAHVPRPEARPRPIRRVDAIDHDDEEVGRRCERGNRFVHRAFLHERVHRLADVVDVVVVEAVVRRAARAPAPSPGRRSGSRRALRGAATFANAGWRSTLPVHTMRVSTPCASMCCWKLGAPHAATRAGSGTGTCASRCRARRACAGARTRRDGWRSARTAAGSCAGGARGTRAACAAARARTRRRSRTARSSTRPRRR